MDENWIEFEEGPASPRDRMIVSMNRHGSIMLNGVAMTELNRPEAVTLHFDNINDRIGIRPVSPLMPNAFSMWMDKRYPSGRIAARSFAARHEIKLDYTVRFLGPEMRNDMLIVSLRNTRRSNRKQSA